MVVLMSLAIYTYTTLYTIIFCYTFLKIKYFNSLIDCVNFEI